MNERCEFNLTNEPLGLGELADGLRDPAAGAVVTFDGRVRDHNDGKPVRALEYHAHPVLALSAGGRILEEEAERHGLLKVRAAHRTGPLEIGEAAVWVGVAAAHRGGAFDGARAIMERLKYELPVWKKETYEDGSSEWVGPDNKSAETGRAAEETPEWDAELLEIWISPGNDFRGRHGKERLDHGSESVPEVGCVAGMGLRGDRYFGYKPDYKGQVTFFDADAVEAVRREFGVPDLAGSEFRRNLIVRGVALGDWVGKRFRFQGVEFEGSEECKPCYWMDESVAPGVEGFLKAKFRGGLRARVLGDGTLRAAE